MDRSRDIMVRRIALVTGFLLGLGTLVLPVRAEGPPVAVASIGPLQALLTHVMQGVARPSVILPRGVSPHHFSLRPSDAARLENADIVFWVGPAMEQSLTKALDALAGDAVVVPLMDTPGLPLLKPREGGLLAGAGEDDDHEDQSEHDDEHGHDDAHAHEHEGGYDPHIWLDPRIAGQLLGIMADHLGRIDPAHAAVYARNAKTGQQALDSLQAEVDLILQDVRSRPFVLFHDAYQYFERRFDLTPLAIVTVDADRPPGARRMAAIQHELGQISAEGPEACIFIEPLLTPRLMEILTEGTHTRTGVIDPVGITGEGSAGEGGLADYLDLIRTMARDMASCLAHTE